MIRHVASGMRVELHYRADTRSIAPHLARGTVVVQAHGRGPRNALVLLDDGRRMVVPCGNLMEVKI